MQRWIRVVLLVLAAWMTWSCVAAALDREVVTAVLNGVLAFLFVGYAVDSWRHRGRIADDGPVQGAPEDLRARGARRRIVPIVAALLVTVLGLLQTPTVIPFYALAMAALMIWQLRTGGDQVDFGDEALVVRRPRGPEKRYAWTDVLELSWSSLGWPNVGAGPVVRVRGSVFETPGPASPGQVAAVLLAGDEAQIWGRLQVRRAAALHDIPYTDGLVDLINSGKRKPRLPGEIS